MTLCRQIKAVSAELSYGWGVVPATIRVGQTEWTTSLVPKDGRYLVPVKDLVRKAEKLEHGETVTVALTVGG